MAKNDDLDSNDVTRSHRAGSFRELLAIAFPMVVSQACFTVMTFTDRLFLSRLGSAQMDAAMAGGLMVFVLMTFFIGLTGYATALVAQYLGSGRKDRCAVATTQAMLVALAAYPIILLTRPVVHLIFRRIGISEAQLVPQLAYFDILIYATVVSLLRSCLSSFFSGIGKTRIVMIAAATAMVVNIGMNYLLIFGNFGFPAWGIRGAACGTIIGGTCGLAVMLAAYLGPKIRQAYQVGRSFRYDRESMGTLLRFGYPAGLEMFLNLVAFNAMILAFHAHSPVTATAVTIMFNWDMVSFVPLTGIQIGVMSLVGRYMGAGNPDLAHRSVMSGLKGGWLYSAAILVLFVGFPDQMVNIFRPEHIDEVFQKAAPLAGQLIRVASMYVMVEAVVIVFSGALRGAGDTFWAMRTSVLIHWLMLVMLLVVLYALRQPPVVAWIGIVASFMVFSGLFYWRYRGGKWRSIRMVAPTEALATDHDQDFHEPPDL